MLKFYLFLYNIVQFGGWSFILFNIIKNLSEGESERATFASIVTPLFYFQNAAILEVFHSLLGFVRSPLLTTVVQVASRILLTAVVTYVPIDPHDITTFRIALLMVSSWSTVEIVRYLYYALNSFKVIPGFLLWLRYSLFIVLYPSGVAGEVGVLYRSLPFFRDNKHLNENFEIIYYALVFILITYIPGLPFMMSHMLHQRKKMLGSHAEEDKHKKKH